MLHLAATRRAWHKVSCNMLDLTELTNIVLLFTMAQIQVSGEHRWSYPESAPRAATNAFSRNLTKVATRTACKKKIASSPPPKGADISSGLSC